MTWLWKNEMPINQSLLVPCKPESVEFSDTLCFLTVPHQNMKYDMLHNQV